jgi:hypothetical protein
MTWNAEGEHNLCSADREGVKIYEIRTGEENSLLSIATQKEKME